MKPHNLQVSDHALSRFRERTGSKESDIQIANKLRDAVAKGEEMELLEQFRVKALLDHGFKDARYFKLGAGLVVVEGNIIVTMHNAEANRWRKIPCPK